MESRHCYEVDRVNYWERHIGDYARDAGHLSMLEHGAYTLVGRNELPNGITDGRRIWLAGVSAQRGF